MLFLFRSMSEKRTLLSRPRTRVYDCNYNIGEGYYKPMMDHLDRKYYGSSATPVKPVNKSSLFGSSGASSAFDEYRSSSPARSRRSGSDSRLSLPDDDFEQEVILWKIHRARIVSFEVLGFGYDSSSVREFNIALRRYGNNRVDNLRFCPNTFFSSFFF